MKQNPRIALLSVAGPYGYGIRAPCGITRHYDLTVSGIKCRVYDGEISIYGDVTFKKTSYKPLIWWDKEIDDWKDALGENVKIHLPCVCLYGPSSEDLELLLKRTLVPPDYWSDESLRGAIRELDEDIGERVRRLETRPAVLAAI